MKLKLAAGCLIGLLSSTRFVSTTDAFSSFHHPTKASSDFIARTTLLTAKISTIPNILQSELVELHDGDHNSSPINEDSRHASGVINRRLALKSVSTVAVGSFSILSSHPLRVQAKTDCMGDCLKNCKLIAPKDPGYCLENCRSYCEQEDRTDGLSGSVNSNGGEMGILGTSTVVKGEDMPPPVSLPGLDFTSEKGRKLIGY